MHTRLLGHSARLSMVLALVGATLFGAAPRARAAIVDATVSNLAVVPATGSPWRTLTTSFDWCVPDGSQPGDSFVVGLPDVLGTWPSTFPLESTAGTVVADGVINAGPPSYLTVTLTDAVAGQSNVCGTVELQSQARNGAGVAGTTRWLDFNTPTGVQSATVSFDELGPGGTNPGASKGGWFSSAAPTARAV